MRDLSALFWVFAVGVLCAHSLANPSTQPEVNPQPVKWVEGVPVFEPVQNPQGWSTVICRRENTVVIGAENLE